MTVKRREIRTIITPLEYRTAKFDMPCRVFNQLLSRMPNAHHIEVAIYEYIEVDDENGQIATAEWEGMPANAIHHV